VAGLLLVFALVGPHAAIATHANYPAPVSLVSPA